MNPTVKPQRCSQTTQDSSPVLRSDRNSTVPFVLLPVRTQLERAYVRAFDLTLACTGLVLFLPVMGLVAAAIKATMPGSILYTQERVTRGEKVFKILKFRTMVLDAEAKTGPVWVGTDDARITPLGRFLRRSHLDELPQLFNVLKGEMSIVGPRPERPVFVEQFKAQGVARYSQRHTVKTGITGHAQLLNPNPSLDQISEKTEADLWYIEHWTPWLDVVLCYKTGMGLIKSILKTTSRKVSVPVLNLVDSSEVSA